MLVYKFILHVRTKEGHLAHARHKKNGLTRSTLKSSGITTTDIAGESREGSQIREAAVQ